jgi:hypothetical protein
MATFWITRLRVIGDGKTNAEIEFGPHLNLISGASDSGKSYILNCIRYMFAAAGAPDPVPEAAGYSTLLMEVETSAGKRFVLQRSLKKGGDLLHHAVPLEEWTGEGGTALKARHSSDKLDNVSRFLLSLCDLADVEIAQSKTKKRSLNFRDIVKFSLIDETAIIDQRTPIYPSRQHNDETADKSVFDFLTSGEDASSLIVAPDAKIEKASWRARYELYSQLMDELKSQTPDVEEVSKENLQRIEAQIEEVSKAIAESNRTLTAEHIARSNLWGGWHKTSARRSVVGELLSRFSLLGEHYNSDIDRLGFLAEADHYLSQIGAAAHCPVCGALIGEHAESEHEGVAVRSDIRTAAAAESAKLKELLDDLGLTQETLAIEADDLDAELSGITVLIDEIDAQISEDLVPQLQLAKGELSDLFAERSRCIAEIDAHARLRSLAMRQGGLGPEPKQKRQKKRDKDAAVVEPAHRREFLNRVQKLLTAWRYTPVDIAEFNPEDMDLVVAGQTRRSHGKGYRAILLSAFTIALMLQAKGRHPALVILDSPLTSYRENDAYELEADIQRGFFEHLLNFTEGQVIVLENKEPPADLQQRMHYEHFSGVAGLGRKGFYPE